MQNVVLTHDQHKADTKVFIMKVVGDQYRYLSEINQDKKHIVLAQKFYSEAVG
jgi:uncharacterized protein YtpQ (UPF0354 family)